MVDATSLIDQFSHSMSSGHLGRAFKALSEVLHADSRIVVRDLRFCMALRPSEQPRHLLNRYAVELRRIAESLATVDNDSAERLVSFAAYAALATRMAKDEVDVLAEFRGDRLLALKSVLTFADDAFDPDWSWNPERDTRSTLTREEVASGASYALALMSRIVARVDPKADFAYVQPDLQKARDWIARCAALDEIRQLEQFVFRLGFSCVAQSDGSFKVFHSDPEIEKTLGTGYTQTFVERAIKSEETSSHVSVADLLDSLLKSNPGVSQIREEADGRMMLHIIEPIARWLGARFVERKELFAEEWDKLRDAAYELHTHPARLLAFQVSSECTLFDMLTVVRACLVMQRMKVQSTRVYGAGDQEYRERNVLGVVPGDKIEPILLRLGANAQAVQLFMKEFVWSVDQPQGVVDLQYRPMVRVGSRVVVPYRILTMSHFYRNTLVVLRQRLFADGRGDPLAPMLADALSKHAIKARANVKYVWDGREREIDVLAIGDGVVVALECKNSILPTNAFELRTTFDYLEKAATQLDKFRTALESADFRKQLGTRMGCPIPESPRLVTAIALGNELFAGGTLGGHPVRGAADLRSLLSYGWVHSKEGNRWIRHRLWKEATFSWQDLIDYCGRNSAFWRAVLAAVVEQEMFASSGRAKVSILRYGLDYDALCDRLKSEFHTEEAGGPFASPEQDAR
jgi:hypothetical protein